MALSDRVADSDACSLSRRWALDPVVARKLVDLDGKVGAIFSAQGLRWPGLSIISGFRSHQKQAALNPDAPDSYHTRCPALAVDLRVGDAPARTTPFELWAVVGQQWKLLGGRWGGDFAEPDPNHFDFPALAIMAHTFTSTRKEVHTVTRPPTTTIVPTTRPIIPTAPVPSRPPALI